MAHQVVTKLTMGLKNLNHVLVMDNFFTNVGIFHDLECRGIYATKIMKSKCVGLHPNLWNTKRFKRRSQLEDMD